MKEALSAIVSHAFDDHTVCTKQKWCKYDKKQNFYKHKRLPYGRDLKGDALRQDMQALLNRYTTESMLTKLSTLQSTNSNENMNQLISRKAQKALHYSGSESLDYRMSAAVSQKNDGISYMIQVNEKHHSSPGKFTEKRFACLDLTHNRRKYSQNNVEKKRRRLELKNERFSRTAMNKRSIWRFSEDPTYQPAVDHVVDDRAVNTTPIPAPLIGPGSDIPTRLDITNTNLVCFDFETTGGGYDDDMKQIAAKDISTGVVISSYVIPTSKAISRRITNLTGLEVHGQIMYHNLQPVKCYQIKNALSSFDTWLQNHGTTILVAHNPPFDLRMLINANMRTGISVCSSALGIIDTLPIFRRAYPWRDSYKQESLVQDLVKREYDAHSAVADVDRLVSLWELVPGELSNCQNKITSVGRVRYNVLKAKNEKANFESFAGAIKNKFLTKTDGKLIAGPGLSLTDINVIFQRSGQGTQ